MPSLDSRAKRIKYCRQYRVGLRQIDFAHLFGVSRASVANWERLDVECGIEFPTVQAMAKACGTTSEWILTGEGDPPPPIPSVSPFQKMIGRRPSTDTPRSKATHERTDKHPDPDVLRAAVEIVFLMLAGRQPTEAEQALVARESQELSAARRVLARYQKFAARTQIQPQAPVHKDDSITAPG